jgi:hypothetical protein
MTTGGQLAARFLYPEVNFRAGMACPGVGLKDFDKLKSLRVRIQELVDR